MADSSVIQTRPAPMATPGFRAAAQHSTRILAESTGLDLCLVLRYVDQRWAIAANYPEHPLVTVDSQLGWSDAVCSKMFQRLGPPVAPRLADVPAYLDVPVVHALSARSYAGLPLLGARRELLGSICGFGYTEMQRDPRDVYEVLRAQAASLSALLVRQMDAEGRARQDDLSYAQQYSEGLTNLPDRAGWGMLLAREEARAHDSVHATAVVVISVDQVKSARRLRVVAGAIAELFADRGATVARLDGRQFGVLLPGCSEAGAASGAYEIVEALSLFGLTAHAGWATRQQSGTLQLTWAEADRRLLDSRRALTR
jgi:GGDEF domain-containing protein